MTVEGHTEVLPLLCARLGSHQLFLGHDWLTHHNPLVDWRLGTISFNRCPTSCSILASARDDEPDPWEGQGVENGDTIYALDLNAYLVKREEHMHLRRTLLHARENIWLEEDSEEQRKKFNETVPPEYHSYWDVFSKAEFDRLPPRHSWDHAIELTKDFKPVHGKVYPLSRSENEQLDKFIDENLDTGRIRPSNSPMASPFFFIKKQDGGLRPVQDYRKLNDMTIKNRYPLPLIQEMLDKLKGARYFTKLDVRWGYNNVRIKEGDEWKAAFVTNRGLFEPLVMFFGLTNSPATFQAMMNELFADLIHTGKVIIYLDDILIFTNGLDEHRRLVHRVLQVFRKESLSLKTEKCEFHSQEVKYLGLIVGNGEIRMDPSKVHAVSAWPVPTTRRELQSFLGFCNYYRRFILDFSKASRPLHDLTKRDVPFNWGVEQQSAFETLKSQIISEPVLVMPEDNAPYRVECDASDHALGGVLSQHVGDKWRPVAFFSASLSSAERNYEIYDKELLAIMRCLEEWRAYLLGTVEPFEIWTDHQNLTYFREARKLNCRQARWFTELCNYNFALIHKPGTSMGKPDGLSRQKQLDDRNDNKDVVLLTRDQFRTLLRLTAIDFEGPDGIIYNRICDSKLPQEELDKKLKEYLMGDDGVILYKGHIYVPPDAKLREDILRARHDTPAASHPGVRKMQELVKRDFWWPSVRSDVRKYITGCDTCQRVKIDRTK